MLREKWYAEIGYGVQNTYQYKNKFLEKVIDEEWVEKEKWRHNSEMKRNYHEKMDNYAKFVKEMHWPEISNRKRVEAERNKKILDDWGKPLWKRFKHSP